MRLPGFGGGKKDGGDIQQKINKLHSLLGIAQVVNSTLDIGKLLITLMEQVTKVVDAEAGSIALLDEVTGELVFDVALGEKGEELKQVRMRPGEGIAGWVIKEGKAAVVNDVTKDPHFFPRADQVTKFKTRSIMAVPLKIKDKVIGVMEAVNKRGGIFDDEDRQMLEAFSAHAAIAVENARLYARCERRGRDLMELNKQMQETQNRLLQSERFSAIGEVAGNIASQLVSPLKAVAQGLAELQKKLAEIKIDLPLVEKLAAENEKMMGLLSSMVSFSAKEEKKEIKATSDVAEALGQAVVVAEAKFAAQKVGIKKQVAPHLPPVYGNTAELAAAIGGVLDYALGMLVSPNELTILVSYLKGMKVPEAPKLTNFVEIRFSDNGRGIAPDSLLRIFDPAFTLEEKTIGNLAVPKKIISSSGGQLVVDSFEGTGSTYTIRLPIAE